MTDLPYPVGNVSLPATTANIASVCLDLSEERPISFTASSRAVISLRTRYMLTLHKLPVNDKHRVTTPKTISQLEFFHPPPGSWGRAKQNALRQLPRLFLPASKSLATRDYIQVCTYMYMFIPVSKCRKRHFIISWTRLFMRRKKRKNGRETRWRNIMSITPSYQDVYTGGSHKSITWIFLASEYSRVYYT